MGRPAALLGTALFAALVVYYETSTHWWSAGIWWDVAWIAAALMPAVFALVFCALPLRRWRGLLPVGVAFGLLSVVLTLANIDVFANFARLAAASLLGFWFLGFFDAVSWVVLVAVIVPWVDAYSVWRGPTKEIVAHHEHVFTGWVSFAFPVPGEEAASNLGVPDLFFFSIFLAAAARFELRVRSTYVGLVAGLALTIVLTVWLDLSGLPALPGIAAGFLLPNADLLWAQLRGGGRAAAPPGDRYEESPGSSTART